jgi:DNA-binding NarL/FixJ family response regulator
MKKMGDKIRIAILDDHQIVIDGLKLVLQNNPKFDVVIYENDGSSLIAKLADHPIDVLLTDIMMPEMDGYELSLYVRTHFPMIKIIALTMSHIGSVIHRMMEDVEIEGYLLKTSSQEKLYNAIETVYQGGHYFEEKIWSELDSYNETEMKKNAIRMTPREIEIIKCIAQNMTNRQIADSLIISERTVETHRKNIFRKSETHSAIGLLEFARAHRYIV